MKTILIFLLATSLLSAQQLAFPSAEGHGRFATGGRGGQVIYVTNLNNNGAGSLRDALAVVGAKTIVFRVGGTIQCTTNLNVNDNTTIAGQTAPGGGIAIAGAELRITGSNIIIRHIRSRLGDVYNTGSNRDSYGVKSYSGVLRQHVILDHCSFTWGSDENVEIGGIGTGSRVANITMQNCIVAENLETHYNLLLWNRAGNVSIIKNLFAHGVERNIRSSTCESSFEMINNLVYNFSAGTLATYENEFDVVNNVYVSKPGSSISGSIVGLVASTNNCPDGNIALTRAYINGNLWNGGAITVSSNLNPYLQAGRLVSSGYVPMATNLVEAYVLANAGARAFTLDAVDNRIITETTNRTGNYKTSVANAGGYPTIANGTPYTDNDLDGMSNTYEDANGLNKNLASDRNSIPNNDGYTALENFLNSLVGESAGSPGDAPTSVTISGGTLEISLLAGEATQLTFEVLPSTAEQSVTWASENPAVATVDVNGRVTGVAVGITVVTATSTVDNNISGNISIRVTQNAPPVQVNGTPLSRKIIIN